MTEPTNPLSNLVEFLHFVNENQNTNQPSVQELDDNKTIEDTVSENSSISIEEEIPPFFHKMEAEYFEENGLVPKSLIRQSIYKEILKEEDQEKRNKLLLYYSLYNTDKDISSALIFENIKNEFEKIYLLVCWRFYKLLDSSSEFEDLVIEKILENHKYELFAYHFTFHTKTDIDLRITDYENFTKDKEKDRKDYRDIVHSVFDEIYN